MQAYRLQQQRLLWKELEKLNTPVVIMDAFKRGILSCDPHVKCLAQSVQTEMDDTSTVASSESIASSFQLTREAVSEQETQLGWDNFHHGRISMRWQEAFYQECLSQQRWADKRLWAASVVRCMLKYSHSLLTYRCALLHSCTKEESHQIISTHLQQEVSSAYEVFSRDPFVIPYDACHNFHPPLAHCLTQDVDSLQYFLKSYGLAIQRQDTIWAQQLQEAKQFFFPHYPLTQTQSVTDDDCTLTSTISVDSVVPLL